MGADWGECGVDENYTHGLRLYPWVVASKSRSNVSRKSDVFVGRV